MEPTLSIGLPSFSATGVEGWERLVRVAEAADRAGVDRVAVSDHILFGEAMDAYSDPSVGGTAGGRQPTRPDGHWLEPLTVLTLVAGRTSRVRLVTSILLAALRPAAVLAKQVATLDVLSGGRVDLGVGVGWQREEYEACGLPFERRGALLDRCLERCKRLWTEPVVDLDDGEVRFDKVHAMPKPVQPGGVPIWVSGRCRPRTIERVVRFGDGWIPWGDDIADPSPGVAAMRAALAAAGRDPSTLRVQGTLRVVRDDAGAVDVDATVAGVPALVEAGVTDLRFPHRWGDGGAADEALLHELVDAFRRAAGREPVAT